MNEINVSDIFQKLRSREDIINFFREQSNINKFIKFLFYNLALFYPKNPHFSKSFLIGVLCGRKKLLPIGCMGGGFSFPYYSKQKQLTKEDIFKVFANDETLLAYLPDNPDIRCITREYLLSVLFFSNREKYLELYSKYKDIQTQRTTTGNKKYFARITNDMLDRLKAFKSINL